VLDLCILIPYRDRAENLKKLVELLWDKLEALETGDAEICVVEQEGWELFNKGRLYNAGFDFFCRDKAKAVCLHDVDLLPEESVCYRPTVCATHLASHVSQHDYKSTGDRAFGGVVILPSETFVMVNGFSNEYWGWGSEDDNFRDRFDWMGRIVQRRESRFTSLPHEVRASMWDDTLPETQCKLRNRGLWEEQRKHGVLGAYLDGLRDCPAKVIYDEDMGLYRYALVNVGVPCEDPSSWKPWTSSSSPAAR